MQDLDIRLMINYILVNNMISSGPVKICGETIYGQIISLMLFLT